MSCEEPQTLETSQSFDCMGTRISVSPAKALPIVQLVFEEIDLNMSEWKSDSELSKINMNAGCESVKCSAPIIKALQQALAISDMTKGAFDPTWACMWTLWDFEHSRVPADIEVQERLSLVQWKNVVVTDNTVYLNQKGMMLGLGGIAKGIALDNSKNELLFKGHDDFMLVAGGQVLVQGKKRRIGIRKPDGMPSEYVAIVEIENCSIATSGDYEKYFIDNGLRYHHIIDPQTGFPAKGPRSVTVITKDSYMADGLSTGLFVMGAKQAIALVDTLEGIEALIVEQDGSLLFSRNFSDFLCDSNSIKGSSSSDLISASDE